MNSLTLAEILRSETRKVFLKISLFVVFVLSIAVCVGAFEYIESKFNMTYSTVSEPLRFNILIGDTVQLSRLAHSILENNGFESASVYDDTGNVIVSTSVQNPDGLAFKFGHPQFYKTFKVLDNNGVLAARVTLVQLINLYVVLAIFAAAITLSLGFLSVIFKKFGKVSDDLSKPIIQLADAIRTDADINDEFEDNYKEISKLASVYSNARKQQTRIAELESEVERQSAIRDVSRQVAHDIRSPVMALQAISTKISSADTAVKKVFDNCIRRINSIADDLLTKSKTTAPLVPTYNLSNLISEIIEEKRLEYVGKNISFVFNNDQDIQGPLVDQTTLTRVISNLINNSVEATEHVDDKSIVVTLSQENQFISVAVKDNGKGIPSDILQSVGTKGFTFGKVNGFGLGLSFAKKTITEIGGLLNVYSKVGEGTMVVMKLPRTLTANA